MNSVSRLTLLTRIVSYVSATSPWNRYHEVERVCVFDACKFLSPNFSHGNLMAMQECHGTCA